MKSTFTQRFLKSGQILAFFVTAHFVAATSVYSAENAHTTATTIQVTGEGYLCAIPTASSPWKGIAHILKLSAPIEGFDEIALECGEAASDFSDTPVKAVFLLKSDREDSVQQVSVEKLDPTTRAMPIDGDEARLVLVVDRSVEPAVYQIQSIEWNPAKAPVR